MKRNIFIVIFLALILGSCELLGNGNNIIVTPADGETVSGIVTILIQAPSGVAVDTLNLTYGPHLLTAYTSDFNVDGQYSHEWDTTQDTNGTYTVTAILVDQNYSDEPYSNSITVHVQN